MMTISYQVFLTINFILISDIISLRTEEKNEKRVKIVIDTDAGGDDAVAIFLAIAAGSRDRNIQIVAITCSYGNTYEKNVESNILKIKTVAKENDIPVFGGVERPLINDFVASNYFGKDGFGDFNFAETISGKVKEDKHASVAMIELAEKYEGDLNIITLGPLTNLALAMSLDPKFVLRIKKFYVMGSAINELNNLKKMSVLKTEFNFQLDPESVSIFFKTIQPNQALLCPWDTVIASEISKEWRLNRLGQKKSEVVKTLNKIENISLGRSDNWLPADSITVAIAIWPELITYTQMALVVTNIADCDLTNRGAIFVNFNDSHNNIEILTSFNVSNFKDKLIHYL